MSLKRGPDDRKFLSLWLKTDLFVFKQGEIVKNASEWFSQIDALKGGNLGQEVHRRILIDELKQLQPLAGLL